MTSIDLIEWASEGIDLAGVAILLVGIGKSTVDHPFRRRQRPGEDRYRRFWRSGGRSILLGLEFLLATGIIRKAAA